jgi:hypothetical protein
MCQRVQCGACGKPTYVGCGRHVEQVLGDVPRADRCRCREEKKNTDAAVSLTERIAHLFGRT